MIDYGAADPLLDDEHLCGAHLIEVETNATTLRYNTSGWDLDWAGNTYLAGGNVLGVDLPDEDATLEAHGAVITVGSLNPAQTSLALSNNLHGKYAAVHHAVLNTSYQIAGVAKVFSGRVSNMVLNKPAVSE